MIAPDIAAIDNQISMVISKGFDYSLIEFNVLYTKLVDRAISEYDKQTHIYMDRVALKIKGKLMYFIDTKLN